MNRRLAFALLGLLALLLAALWPLRTAQRASEHSAAPAAPQPAVDSAAPAARSAPAASAAPPASTTPPAPSPRPIATIRKDFESEPRDATAPAAEARIREIFMGDPMAQGMLRQVRCSQTVCKIDARWSAQLNRGYNSALLKVIHEFSKEVSLEPDGPPDGMTNPVTIYVRRTARAAQAPAAQNSSAPAP